MKHLKHFQSCTVCISPIDNKTRQTLITISGINTCMDCMVHIGTEMSPYKLVLFIPNEFHARYVCTLISVFQPYVTSLNLGHSGK